MNGLNSQVALGNTLYGFAAFTANKVSVGKYEYVQFKATLPSTAVACYWDFGDGTTGTGTTIMKNWTAQGQYTIALVYRDTYGRSNTVLKNSFITVSNSITAFPLDPGYVGMSGTPKQVFSFRQLLSTATLCCRIRRSSDNTETDFGFTNQGYLDVAAVTLFLSGSTGYISKWYDQAGFADSVQTTLTAQPVIDISGTYAHAIYTTGTASTISALTVQIGPSRNFVMNLLGCTEGSYVGSDTNSHTVFAFGSIGGAYVRIDHLNKTTWAVNYNAGSGGTGINGITGNVVGTFSSMTMAHDTASKLYMMYNSNLQNPGGTGTLNDSNQNATNPVFNVSQIAAPYSTWVREAVIILSTNDYAYIDGVQKNYYTDRN